MHFSWNWSKTFCSNSTKPVVPVVTLSTQDSAKRLQVQILYLDYLIDWSFLVVNRLFVLLFKNNDNRTGHTGYFFPQKPK